MKSAPDSKKLKRLTPKEVLYEGSREIQLPQAEQPMESYYVYGPDGEVAILSTAGEAISLAYEISGKMCIRDRPSIWVTILCAVLPWVPRTDW